MLCVWVVYFSRVQRESVCARVQESALCGRVSLWQCMLDWSDGPPVLSEARGIHSLGQMGRDSFASEVAE